MADRGDGSNGGNGNGSSSPSGGAASCVVRTWLRGIGLQHAWPHFEAAGLVTPDAVAELESRHFAALRVRAADDRRKLFFLVQRVRLELEQQQQAAAAKGVKSSPASASPAARSKENHKPPSTSTGTPSPKRKEAAAAPRQNAGSAIDHSASLDDEDQFYDTILNEELETTNDDDDDNDSEYDDDEAREQRHHRDSPPAAAAAAVRRNTRQSTRRLREQQQSSTTATTTTTTNAAAGVPQSPGRRAASNNNTITSSSATGTSNNSNNTVNGTRKTNAAAASPTRRTATAASAAAVTAAAARKKTASTAAASVNSHSKEEEEDVQMNGMSSMPISNKSSSPHQQQRTSRLAQPSKTKQPARGRRNTKNNNNSCSSSEDDNADDSSQQILSRSASDILEDALHSDNDVDSDAALLQQANNNSSSNNTTEQQQQPRKKQQPRRSSGLVAPSQRDTTKSKTAATGATGKSTAANADATSNHKSRMANPSRSMRTGKQLSAIPADSVPPMSPLVELKLSEQAADSAQQQQQQQHGKKIRRRRSGSLDGAMKRQLNATTTAYKTNSDDDDDDDNSSVSSTHSHRHRRRSSLTRSTSDRSAGSAGSSDRSSRRRSSLSRAASDRSLSSADNSGASHQRRQRRASVASSQPSSRRASPGPRRGSSVESSRSAATWREKIEGLREQNAAEFELFHGGNSNSNLVDSDDYDSNNQDDADAEMRIRVVVRKRPMSPAEIAAAGDVDVIHSLDYNHRQFGRILVYQPKQRVDLTQNIETVPFAFDNVFDCSATNVEIYQRSVRGLLPSLFDGQWASIFAYGQTGSGKTFTMMGNNFTGMNNSDNATNSDVSNLGLYYMAALDLFHAIKTPGFEHFSIAVSFFEIYGGKLFDLLNDRASVKCLEDAKGKVCFPGLSEHPVANPDALISLIELGASNRSTGTTSRNADSSRSHAVLQLHLQRKSNNSSKNSSRRRAVAEFSRLTFIDLAGSERGADTSTASRATRLEGAEINTSLLALKEVIRALATGDSLTHVPFRGSKLTQVLKESFVGKNGRSVMIACISPNIVNCEQTLNTLRYADRVKERNPETGELGIRASSNSSAVNNSKSTARAKSAPRYKLSPNVSLAMSDSLFDQSDSNTSEVLDDLLAASPCGGSEIGDEASTLPDGSFVAENDAREPHVDYIQELIATHKDAMAVFLDQVKEEMVLVNQADSNREELMDAYMGKIHAIQDEQLAMITLLREQLLQYRLAQAGVVASSSLPQHGDEAHGILATTDDNDSFEDLRD